MDEMTFVLNSPITEEQWDAITDVDFERTNEITFHTKHDKTVKFVKVSAQPENLQPTCNQLATDCISRQAAIDAILAINDYGNSDRANALGLAEFKITTLPTAEQQIIYCNDCRYWDKYSDYATLGSCGIWQVNRTRKDYCSEAIRKE